MRKLYAVDYSSGNGKSVGRLRFASQLLAVFLLALLSACNGGQGSAGGSSVLGGSSDPFSDDDSLQTLANSLDFITPIAYVRRPLPQVDNIDDPLDFLALATFAPGASLYIRAGASLSASEFNISDRAFASGLLYDVKDISVSPDGEKLLFAMHAPEADPDDPVFTWNIWEYDLVNDSLRRIISDDFIAEEGHDINPVYLANGDILFSSSRQSTNRGILIDEGKPQYSGQIEAVANNSVEANHTFNLHVIDDDSDTITQLTFNQSHDFSPIVQADGSIAFIRWDNIANTNQISIYQIAPDGSDLTLKYGYHSLANTNNGGEGFLTRLRKMPSGNLLAITQDTPNTITTLGGDIIEVDITNFVDLNTPTFANAGLSTQATDRRSPAGVDVADPLSAAGRYLSAWPLNDGTGRLLVSWSACRAIDPANLGVVVPRCNTAPANAIPDLPVFELWVYDPGANTQLPIARVDAGEMLSEVVAMESLFIATPLTGSIDPILETDQQAVLNIRSIYDLDGVDIANGGIAVQADPALTSPDLIEAKFLRLVKAVSIPDEDIRDFDNSAFGVNRNQLMREIIGYIPIEPDGSVRAIVPANVPLMFSVVDRNGKRINIEAPNTSLRHQNWLHLPAGRTMECRGCHARNSTTPHGRLDAQAPSIHAGATVSLPYPNTEPGLFAPNGGETMAEIYAAQNGIAGRLPNIDLIYNDDWTDDSGVLTKTAGFQLEYGNLDTASPASSNCMPWNVRCRSVINYETHIQPLWEFTRTPIDDGSGTNTVDTCVGCHTTNGGSQIPSAQLDLTAAPSDIDADQFTSYRELLRTDQEKVLNGTAIADRLWECNTLDEFNVPVIDPNSDPLNPTILREFRTPDTVPASASEQGANFAASVNFFTCLTQDNACRDNIGPTLPAAFPDECIEFAGDPVLSQPTINHNGLLTDDELRLIAEWLDIGAQYYNNPFDAPL